MSCDNCNGIGHRAENCWTDLICENCHWTGHPTQLCKTLPSKKCVRLARQGIVKGQPTLMLNRLLAAKADPGNASLNH
ncbi:hypothetical protein PHMEG_0005399 [Phytophthora megakarya]|uniref:CCHC-type domain-containing protein n=1 Tax=Phytophthora megakarya TaxID=4795 RepID=A0A225WT21_9STRA|nr:hypothetical protein PHMEG_0005392 [Phytophthora megakarya]OWZ20224.1 hypothetical protein PHMEG_0005399 [Phytophthora megakarya]